MSAWLRNWWARRVARIDGQILRPAIEDIVRRNHPDYPDTEVALVVDNIMEDHNTLTGWPL